MDGTTVASQVAFAEVSSRGKALQPMTCHHDITQAAAAVWSSPALTLATVPSPARLKANLRWMAERAKVKLSQQESVTLHVPLAGGLEV